MGYKISFDYVRQMNGMDLRISWTGTLSGDELTLKRELAGGGGGMGSFGRGMGGFGGRGGGMPGGGRGGPPAGN